MPYLLIITLAHPPIPSQISHTLLDIISLGVDAVLCHDQDTCSVRQFTLAHVAKYHSTISCKMSSNFPLTGFKATEYVHRLKTIDTTVPLYQMGERIEGEINIYYLLLISTIRIIDINNWHY